MKKVKQVLSQVMLMVVALFTLVACSTATDDKVQPSTTTSSSATSSSSQMDTAQSVTLQVLDGDEEVLKATPDIKEGMSVMDVLKANATVEEQDGFITSINHHKQDEKAKKYWLYTVNGETAQVGAKDYKLKAGDKIVFRLDAM
ncbi:MAG: DUF4430 domain-containing protein [Aerococcus sp.]|nr:DUF4430 domain-containing protein [Aerococcus sp.]